MYEITWNGIDDNRQPYEGKETVNSLEELKENIVDLALLMDLGLVENIQIHPSK